MAFVDTSTQSALITAVYDRYARAALRHAVLLRKVADVKPEQPAMPGSSIKLPLYSDLAVVSAGLTETSDPTPVAIPDATMITVTPVEYGLATVATIKARSTAFSDIDPNVADQVTFNMKNSLDGLVETVLTGGTNVIYSDATAVKANNATNTIISKVDILQSRDVREAVTALRGNAAPGRMGELYLGLVHPNVSHDLKAESGAASWRSAHEYAAPDLIWPNMLGVYEGVAFTESARMHKAADGASSANVYRSVILGKQALAEAVVIEPGLQVGVYADLLNRFKPLGWYGYLGWSIFRQASLYRIESASSLI